MIKLVVFDMAGTTVHDGDAVNSSFRAALAAAGVEADAALVNTVMGLPKPEAIRRLLTEAGRGERRAGADPLSRVPPTAGPPPVAEVDAIHEDFVRRMRHYYATDPSVREVPGAAATFAVLRSAGIKVALNTGFSRAVVEVLLARLGWQSPAVIDAEVASDEVLRGRPYPDMIRLLMEQLDIQDARKVAKVGDTRADLEEGINACCGLVIGVTTGSTTGEQLRSYPHSHILTSVVDVPKLLLR
jgi:phosphonatase-like hydrolase